MFVVPFHPYLKKTKILKNLQIGLSVISKVEAYYSCIYKDNKGVILHV